MSTTTQASGPPVPAPAADGRRAVVPAHRDRREGDPVDAQLARLEARLLGEVEGDPAASTELRSHLAAARERFAGATVRQFLPILVEREVRRCLREDARPR